MRISIIGAGNVAWHLAPALASVADVRQVISRHEDSAGALATRVNAVCGLEGREKCCKATASLDCLYGDSDLYLIVSNDDSIATIASSTENFPGIWAHTSGSVGLEVFDGEKTAFGSFYPLQTFSKEIPVDVGKVPFFVEGSRPEVLETLKSVAGLVSSRVYTATSRRRRALHLAAVFACNFANQMWAEADILLRKEGLDITCLLPLLEATLGKLGSLSPAGAMTGPAQRGDMNVLRRHIEELPDEEMKELYRIVSQRILDASHPELII